MTNKQHDNTQAQTHSTIPAHLKQVRRISPFWLLPFVALCIGAILFFQIIQEQGHTIRITFANGEGLVAGKRKFVTKVYKSGLLRKSTLRKT